MAMDVELIHGENGISRYIDNATHQIKTPLTVIRTYMELIQAELYGPLSSELSSKLETISANIDEISHFTEQVHDVIVLCTEKQPPEAENVDISMLIEQVAGELSGLACSHSIEMELHGLEDGIELEVNEHWMRRSLVHLIRFSILSSIPGRPLSISIENGGKRPSMVIRPGEMDIVDIDMDLMEDFMIKKDIGGSTLDWERLSLPIARCMVRTQGGDVKLIREDGRVIGFSLDL